MGGDRLMGLAALRRAAFTLSAAVLAGMALGAGSAQAATVGRLNRAGTYSGEIWQILPTAPNLYIGHIHFTISGGKIFGLRFTAQTMCGALSAIDTDNALPEFPLTLQPTGRFAYGGTVAGRVLRLRGKITGNTAHGTFFQSFSASALTCSMGQPAAFTATRR